MLFRFLTSETVSLGTESSTRTFRIHKALLLSKSKAIFSAFEHCFPEKENGVYKFKETTEGTVARFIEWAYRGDYPDAVYNAGLLTNDEDSAEDAKVETVISSTKDNLSSDDHPLLSHMQLYIFCEIYGITQLKELVFSKLTSRLTEIEKPNTLVAQLAIIAVLRICFTNIHPDNDLADWLAQYAAYCVDTLRLQMDFHDLLRQAPTLGSRMMIYLQQSSTPPWNSSHSKDKFPWSVEAVYSFDFKFVLTNPVIGPDESLVDDACSWR